MCSSGSADFWLPPGTHWYSLDRGDSLYLTLAPWVALGLLLVRAVVESWFLEPLGLALGIVDRWCSSPQSHPFLENAFKHDRHPSKEQMNVLAKEVGWTHYKVQRWFWRARNHKKPSMLTKFKETSWRFLAYCSLVGYGLWSNMKEPCFWDQSRCWDGYPGTPSSDNILTYWTAQLAFYSSLLVSQFKDIRRKDFRQMFLHHVTTIALLGFAYSVNMINIGALIALVHDVSDVPLELAKLFHYTGRDQFANVAFCVFSLVFVTTRLVLLPFWLIYSVYYNISALLGAFPALYIFVGFLLILQALHVYWFKLILNMVFELVYQKGLNGDTRSDSELSDCTNHSANGKKTL